VRNHGDHFRGAPVDPADRALAGPIELSHQDALAEAADRAAQLGITAGARVLIDTAAHPEVTDWLLAPLVVGASIVLCANLDLTKTEARAATEKVTLLLT
jgi:nucleotide-binding universal stress UspA family protein